MKPLILETGRNRLILTDLPDGLSIKMEFDGAGLAMIERDPERIMAICRAAFAAYRRVKRAR